MSVALDSLKRLVIRRDSSAPRASGHVTQLSLTDNVDNLSPGTRWSRHLSLRINARSSLALAHKHKWQHHVCMLCSVANESMMPSSHYLPITLNSSLPGMTIPFTLRHPWDPPSDEPLDLKCSSSHQPSPSAHRTSQTIHCHDSKCVCTRHRHLTLRDIHDAPPPPI